MSFSSDVKEELSKMPVNNIDVNKAEFIGYILSGNCVERENYFEYITENEFNIERFYKILFNLHIDYEPEIRGKLYTASISKKVITDFLNEKDNLDDEKLKCVVRGAFCGSGSINDPNKKYHLEILFNNLENLNYINSILEKFGIIAKSIDKISNYSLYIKGGEEISKFMALIGANKSVLKYEEIRVMRDMRNNVNRKVNCETANLNKVINASVSQIDDIKFLKKMKKYDTLSEDLKEIAELRIENPDASLKELGQMISPILGKSGVNHRLKKIQEIANEIRKGS